jgi:O-antigen/teichoic acid export membrane protein
LHLGFAVILPVCAGMGLLAPEIIAVALGPDWSQAALVLGVIAPITAVYLIAGLSNSLTNALGHPKALFRFKLVSLLLHIPALSYGLIVFGLAGALATCALNALLWYGFSIHVAGRITGLTRWAQVSAIGRSVVSALVMSAVVIVCRAAIPGGADQTIPELLASAAMLAGLGALTYVSCHIILWQLGGRPPGIEQTALLVLAQRRVRP